MVATTENLLCHSLWSITRGQQNSSPLACTMDHTVTFVESTPLVASQWQNHVWTFSLHLLINAEHVTTQVTSTILQQDFDMAWPEINPAYQLQCHVFNPLYHLATRFCLIVAFIVQVPATNKFCCLLLFACVFSSAMFTILIACLTHCRLIVTHYLCCNFWVVLCQVLYSAYELVYAGYIFYNNTTHFN